MALVQFTPTVRLGTAGSTPVFLDAACAQRAQVFNLNGNPLAGNAISVDDSGVGKPFQVDTVTTVYFRHGSGIVLSQTSAGVAAIVSAASKSATLITGIHGI